MAIYEKLEFLKLCGLDTSVKSNKDKFSVWISRGKIVLNKDGLVDDTIAQNRDWILRQQEVAGANQKHHESIEVEQPKKVSKQIAPDSPEGGTYSLDKNLKSEQLRKLRVDIRLAELKEEKLRGEVIPVELVRSIFTTQSQSILTAFKDSVEDILIGVSKKCSMSDENLSQSRVLMVSALNAAVEKSILITKSKLKLIIDEYSVKREAGEHE